MKLLDASFESCGDLQELFQPLSPDLGALQLSSGLLKGRVQAWGFDGFRLNLLTTNQTLFLSGARHPEPCTLALPLDPLDVDGSFKAQGISMPRAGLMGCNRGLIDSDLKLPAGAQLATVVINKAAWVDRHGQTSGLLMMKRWETTNQLEVRPSLRVQLRRHLMALMHCQANTSEQLMQTLIRCFKDPAAETLPIAKREARHQAAIDLLHWCAQHPKTPLKIEEISSEIF